MAITVAVKAPAWHVMRLMLILPVLVLALAGCEKQQAPGKASLSSEVEVHEWHAPGCADKDSCTTVAISREVFAEHPALNKAVRRQLLEQLQGNGESSTVNSDISFEQVAKGFIADAADVAGISQAAWQLTGEAKKLAQHGNLLTVAVTSYMYSGGAHGMPATRWLNWDLEKDSRLELNDVILPGKEAQFWELAIDAHRRWQDRQKMDADFRENWPFARSEDFRITDKGLTLRYGVYTLAPYSMGETELLIPAEKLTDIIQAAYLPTP